jgi:hypothetical protein
MSDRRVSLTQGAYHKMGLSPLYLVDTRSGDDTARILARLGAELVAITPAHDRVESMLACTKTLVESEWVLPLWLSWRCETTRCQTLQSQTRCCSEN